LTTEYKRELLNFLQEEYEKLDAIVMPDFFFDRLVSLDYVPSRFSSLIADITGRKGGSIDDITQVDTLGGNAVNTMYALAALGVNVTPIVCTNEFGLQKMKFDLEKYSVDFSHIKILKKPSLTTALELETESGKANVMFRDVGSLANFGPSNLTERDYDLIENASYVCLFNWAGTKKFGTELAENIFCRVKTRGKGKTYYDTADPTSNKDKIPGLIENVLKTSSVDVLSLNENEAVCYAEMLGGKIFGSQKDKRFDQLAVKAARFLSKALPARIDLHTTVFSATFTKKKEVSVPTFKIRALRATGAGDSWNAGNILGDGQALSDECRLALANAVSAYYISNPDGAHPTPRRLVKFVENSLLNNPV